MLSNPLELVALDLSGLPLVDGRFMVPMISQCLYKLAQTRGYAKNGVGGGNFFHQY